MRIALGCDHRGLALKQAIMGLLPELGHQYEDFGCYSNDSVDYPDVAGPVARAVVSGKFDHGILICGTGIGMGMAANKIRGARAAVCCSTLMADRARGHNDANILCLGSDTAEQATSLDIVKVYLSTDFEGGRHLRRLEKMRNLEGV